MMESDKENLEEDNIYEPDNGDPDMKVLKTTLKTSIKSLKDVSQSIKKYREEIASKYAIVAYCVIAMFIVITPNLVINLAMEFKLLIYCFLALANGIILNQRKGAENCMNGAEQFITQAKNTAKRLTSQLQATLYQKITKLPSDLFETTTRIIIKAGYLSEHFKYPSVFFTIFKNGPLLAALIVSCINLLATASFIFCKNMMSSQCMEIFEQIEGVLSMAVNVLTLQIVTLAITFKQIDRGYLILDQINVWTEKLDELNQESFLLQSNLELFTTLKPNL